MKIFKLVGMALLAIMMSFSLAACGDDDDEDFPGGNNGIEQQGKPDSNEGEEQDKPEGDNNVNTANLVGEWQQTWAKGYEKYNDEPESNSEWDMAASIYHIVFNADGTGVESATEEGETYSYDFTWKSEGNILKITTNEDGIVEVADVKVVELTANTLKMEQSKKDEEGSFYSLDTFKKVK